MRLHKIFIKIFIKLLKIIENYIKYSNENKNDVIEFDTSKDFYEKDEDFNYNSVINKNTSNLYTLNTFTHNEDFYDYFDNPNNDADEYFYFDNNEDIIEYKNNYNICMNELKVLFKISIDCFNTFNNFKYKPDNSCNASTLFADIDNTFNGLST